MRTLPTTMIRVLVPFAPLFSKRVWQHVQLLLTGIDPRPGQEDRGLRSAGGRSGRRTTVLPLPSGLEPCRLVKPGSGRILLGLLVEAFVPEGPLVVGIDETLERRQGKKISAKGIYRDPVQIQPFPLRQNECSQMGVPDAFGRGPLGFSGLGVAVPFGPGLLGALRQRAGQAAQELTEWARQLLFW